MGDTQKGVDLRYAANPADVGYVSITTTEHYLKPMRSLQVAAGDFIQIELVGSGEFETQSRNLGSIKE